MFGKYVGEFSFLLISIVCCFYCVGSYLKIIYKSILVLLILKFFEVFCILKVCLYFYIKSDIIKCCCLIR